MQRACPTLVERPNVRDALDLADVEVGNEDVAVIEGRGPSLVAIKTLLAALVGAAWEVPVRQMSGVTGHRVRDWRTSKQTAV